MRKARALLTANEASMAGSTSASTVRSRRAFPESVWSTFRGVLERDTWGWGRESTGGDGAGSQAIVVACL